MIALEDKIYVLNDWVLVVDDALPYWACDLLRERSVNNLRESSTLGRQIQKYRTSYDSFVEQPSLASELVDEIIVDITSLPRVNQEKLSIIKYAKGQEYKEHYDFLHHVKGETERKGDRLFSAIFYLNDDFEGGQTYFSAIDLQILPKKGRLLIWKNYIGGLPNYDSLHAGLPVRSGEKWIATKWVREKAFEGICN